MSLTVLPLIEHDLSLAPGIAVSENAAALLADVAQRIRLRPELRNTEDLVSDPIPPDVVVYIPAMVQELVRMPRRYVHDYVRDLDREEELCRVLGVKCHVCGDRVIRDLERWFLVLSARPTVALRLCDPCIDAHIYPVEVRDGDD